MERHRDLLPLPLLDTFDGRCQVTRPEKHGLSAGAYRRRLRKYENLNMANEVIETVNQLAGFPSPKAGAPTSNQQHSMETILKQVSNLPRASQCMSMREAVGELLQVNPFSPYDSGEGVGTTVRPYDRELISLPKVGAHIKDAADLVDETGKRFLEAYDSAMLKEDIELDPSDFPKVYMDERLKQSPELYHRFIKDLWERNMIDFSHERVSTVTPFFVVKKSGKLRLVLDCRATNELFRPPPDIAMPAGYSFSQLQMSDEDTLHIAQTDIKDYFYSIGLRGWSTSLLRFSAGGSSCDCARSSSLPAGQRAVDRVPKDEGSANGLELGDVHCTTGSSIPSHARRSGWCGACCG